MSTKRGNLVRTVTLVALLLAACSAAGNSTTKSQAGVGLGAACAQNAPSCNVVWSFSGNSIADGRTGATISGGGQLGVPNEVSGDFGTVGGGKSNVAAEGAVVSGGAQNSATAFHAVVGGGVYNLAEAQSQPLEADTRMSPVNASLR